MRIPGLKTASHALRWLRSRVGRHALVLGYHRIDDPADGDPFSLCVRPRHFGEHLEVLRERANPLSLRALIRALHEGRPPSRAVVVTLDDGYADSLYRASPLLEQFRVPAIVFIATGLLGREAWWDELARMVASSDSPPTQLRTEVEGATLSWDLRASGALTGALPNPERANLIRSLYQTLVGWPQERRQAGLVRLRDVLGVPDSVDPNHRFLRTDELRELAANDLIEVGAHSVSHPNLADLPRDAQQSEIRGSKRALEEILGSPIRSFSYPNGSHTNETVARVRDAGFECACASFGGVARRGSDLFRLPRFWIPDCDGATFEGWLRRWIDR